MKRTLTVAGAVIVTAGMALACARSMLPAIADPAASESERPPTAGDEAKPELGVPASAPVVIGVSPNAVGPAGEVWAYGTLDGRVLLERDNSSPWHIVSLPAGAQSQSQTEYGAFGGQATAAGGVVLLAGQGIVVRNPDRKPGEPNEPTQAPGPTGQPGETVLGNSESLLPQVTGEAITVPYAAIEDNEGPGGEHTGVLIAPANDGHTAGLPPGVLHYDGERWTREPIRKQSGQELERFTALALSCSGTASNPDGESPENCWLLASAEVKRGDEERSELLLYRRVVTEAAGHEWVPEPAGPGVLGEGGKAAVSALPPGAQMLTATAQGVWVDFQEAELHEAREVTREVTELVTRAGSGLESLGSWCFPAGQTCTGTLGARLPLSYRSFAWPGNGDEPGTRIITGLADHAMLELAGGRFTYQVGPGGSDGEAPGGAAFEPPIGGKAEEGWIGDAMLTSNAADGAGQAPIVKLTPKPQTSELEPQISELGEEAVPFRRPLLAVAQAPGTSPGSPDAEALAVGEGGQIARYVPGMGWRAEALYNSSGEAVPTTMRGVAWPEPGRAYAVGDNGAMWLWLASTKLWQPDPARLPNFIGNLQAIAFEPGHPYVGYAVGRQGVLLKFGKSWEQAPPKVTEQLEREAGGEGPLNFTSIAFAGHTAYATYRTLTAGSQLSKVETGGLAVEEVGDGLHWHVDAGAKAVLAPLSAGRHVLSKVAGLPGGGLVAAGPGGVLECESACGEEGSGAASHWSFAPPLPEADNVSALAAYREGGTGALRAIASVDLDLYVDPAHYEDGDLKETPFTIDVPVESTSGQAPTMLGPDMLPNSGYLLKQVAGGWEDMEHEDLPAPNPGYFPRDMPARPDPVLALLVSENGVQGLAVGGLTGDFKGSGGNPNYQTAAAERFPASAAASNGATHATIATSSASASFVVAGQAACVEFCANFANERLGPDVDLEHALQSAKGIAEALPGGLRGFLYTGGRLPASADDGLESGDPEQQAEHVGEFERELDRYAQLLGSAGGTVPVLTASSEELIGTSESAHLFHQILESFTPGAVSGHEFYAFRSSPPSGTTGGEVMVIVLSFLAGKHGEGSELEEGEQAWLAERLSEAKKIQAPAVVMGNDSLGFTLPDENAASGYQRVRVAADSEAVTKTLVEGEASAYFFDYPGANAQTTLSVDGCSIPAYGTGTLGYVKPPEGDDAGDALGSSGFLLAEVQTGAPRRPRCPASKAQSGTAEPPTAATVSVRVVPNIAELSLDAVSGTFLRRSHVALFEALARRPVGGAALGEREESYGPNPYDEIPFDCQGRNCANEIPQEYVFTSSNPEVGGFVEHNPAENNPFVVQLGPHQLPVHDEPRNEKGELNPDLRFSENAKGEPVNEQGEVVPREDSGLFCAYNAGTTTVSVTAGGLTYSEPITVQAGSVEYPCGTVPLKNPPPRPAPTQVSIPAAPAAPPPAGAPPVAPQLPALVFPPPPVPAPLLARPPQPPATLFPVPLLQPFPPVPAVIVPAPPPPAGEPAPPSGAQVFVSSYATKEEPEQDEAPEMVANKTHAMAYTANREPATNFGPWAVLALTLVAAAAGVGIRPRRPGAHRDPQLALATARRQQGSGPRRR